MTILLLLLPFLLTILPTTTAQTCRNNNATALPLPSETIFQFEADNGNNNNNFTFFENIAARANGDLLITMAIPQPTIFLLQDPTSACPTMAPLFTVPGVNGTDGLVEIADRPDVFAVIAGNLSLSGDPANGVPKSWSVWEIDLNGGETISSSSFSSSSSSTTTTTGEKRSINCSSSSPAVIPPNITITRKIADIPQAPRLNGAAAIPGTSAILLGDSQLGVAFRLDTRTGDVTTALDFPEMKPVPGAGSIDDALGLNGMKIVSSGGYGGGGGGGGDDDGGDYDGGDYDGDDDDDGGDSLFLYFTNAAARTINRVSILPDGSGPQPGATVETIASIPESGWMDDLDIRDDGSLWVTTNVPTNSLFVIEPTIVNTTGPQAKFMAPVVAAGSPNVTTIAGDTAAVFGRGNVSNRQLFVACGSGMEPAKIVRIDTTGCE